MPILQYTLQGPSLLAPGVLPINFSLDIPSFNLSIPETPIELGIGPFDFGIEVTFICPGYPFCQAKQACQTTKKTPVWSIDPTAIISTKIPSFSLPIIPDIPKIQFSFPPKFMFPLQCPNYIRMQQESLDSGS